MRFAAGAAAAARARAQIVIVGGDGGELRRARRRPRSSYRGHDACASWAIRSICRGVHFLGMLNYGDYISLLQVFLGARVISPIRSCCPWSLIEGHGVRLHDRRFIDRRRCSKCCRDGLQWDDGRFLRARRNSRSASRRHWKMPESMQALRAGARRTAVRSVST